MTPRDDLRAQLGRLYRAESGRILATLIRSLGSFDAALDVVHEAFAAALAQWPREGIPDNPRAWVAATARHRAIDRLRRQTRFEQRREALVAENRVRTCPATAAEDEAVLALELAEHPDDTLRLFFTCCHPALAPEAQVALTLRTLGGLTTQEVARAFLVPLPTMAQRLVRAKTKIRDANIPYVIPSPEQLPERVDSVLAAVYLIFNEGYAATSGDALVRRELAAEAIRLGRLLCELLPRHHEAHGLLTLMLLHHSRHDARTDDAGEIVLLEAQDRSRWDTALVAEALPLVERALRRPPPGPYALQAAIAAVHAEAPTAADTDWKQIALLYDLLLRSMPTPVVRLNRAVAIAMAFNLERALALIDELRHEGALPDYHLLPAARADLLRRLGRLPEAREAYLAALALCANEREAAFLRRRLRALDER